MNSGSTEWFYALHPSLQTARLSKSYPTHSNWAHFVTIAGAEPLQMPPCRLRHQPTHRQSPRLFT